LDNHFKISLYENGKHSLKRGLEELITYESASTKDNFKLKEAIMFLHHGLELLLKQILVNTNGEYLIFSDIGHDTINKVLKAKKEDQSVFNIKKPVHTATYLEVVQRTKAFVEFPILSESLETRLKELNSLRNNLEHYGIDRERIGVENLLFKLRKPILKFFKDANIEIEESVENDWIEIEKLLLIEAMKLRFSGSIEKVELNDRTATIRYVDGFDEYIKKSPNSNVSKEQYEQYWETGDGIVKALNDGSMRILNSIGFLKGVKIFLPFKDEIFSIMLSRADVEKYIGYSFDEVKLNWKDTFSDRFVYSSDGRKQFFKNFGNKGSK
jgi:hypothetical protein